MLWILYFIVAYVFRFRLPANPIKCNKWTIFLFATADVFELHNLLKLALRLIKIHKEKAVNNDFIFSP